MNMNRDSHRISLVLIICLALLMATVYYPVQVHASPVIPTVGVWSDVYNSPVISDPSIAPNSTIIVSVNVTNAPAFNGYDLTLYYDPAYLKPVFIDVRTGFNHPFIGADTLSPGSIHLAVVDLGENVTATTATIARISFEVMGRGVSPLTLAAAMTHPSIWDQSWTQLVFQTAEIPVQTVDGYFSNIPANDGPVASFTFSPTVPIVGDTVVFDASSSFDPDNNQGANHGIALYIWDFGDGYTDVTNYPADTHRFANTFQPDYGGYYGNFSVKLTVVDSDQGFISVLTQRVAIMLATPSANNFVVATNPTPREIAAGDTMTYAITLTTLGNFTGPIALKGSVVPSDKNGPSASIQGKLNLHGASQLTAVLDIHTTNNTPPGYYTVLVTATGAGISHYGIMYLTVYAAASK